MKKPQKKVKKEPEVFYFVIFLSEEISIFYTEMTRKVDLLSFFMTETSEKICISTLNQNSTIECTD